MMWKIRFLKSFISMVGLVVLGLMVFWLPSVARDMANLNPEYAYLKYPLFLGICGSAIPFYVGVYHSIQLLNVILTEQIWTEKSRNHFKVIANSAKTVIIFYLIGMVILFMNQALHPALLLVSTVVILISFAISTCSLLLSEILLKGILLKYESEWIV